MSIENKENEVKVIKGYKMFDPNWTCRGFKYEVGKSYEMDDDIECCVRGFHFCTKLADCFYYHGFNPDNKIAEIEAYGKIDYANDGSTKACTNKIRIVREILWSEVLSMADIIASNTGTNNAGVNNTGSCNFGNYNTGAGNTGDCNTGFNNKGNGNTGFGNKGNRNAGNNNTGDHNTGGYNIGNCNTGDYNITNHSSGWFCTEEPKVMLFNKLTDMTYKEWTSTEAYRLLHTMPDYYGIGNAAHEVRQKWYDNLSDEDKDIIKSVPNFDADIFKQCTGIDVNKDK